MVVIEYNAIFGPSAAWLNEYNPTHSRTSLVGTMYFGASLKALEMLGQAHGYRLVGCDFLGVNAFFVREDLLQDKFCQPYTSENHYEPSRLFLYRRSGPPRRIGRSVIPTQSATEIPSPPKISAASASWPSRHPSSQEARRASRSRSGSG